MKVQVLCTRIRASRLEGKILINVGPGIENRLREKKGFWQELSSKLTQVQQPDARERRKKFATRKGKRGLGHSQKLAPASTGTV